ncbi:MAG: hypothetical protein FJZ16_08355, partial [Candidatus Omnitrophica bacterium]|nr:hypothetical protein [Candidatus Omnitrophota bacterium]
MQPKLKKIFLINNINTWHAILGILLLCLFLFLSFTITDEHHWSDWAFGDAQSILTIRHWEEKGWLKNKLLFIPQGYARVVELFDKPPLRHHAHGTITGTIGPRLYYTHYPSGYLIPYALLSKMGYNDITYLRKLSLLFSFGAVILMYILFSRITSPRISFVVVVFYLLSPSFLGFANSIANQPIDDLLRFAFMLLIVLSTRTSSLSHMRIYKTSAWIVEFLLSLSSFDSVFFVYIWLVGWDLIEHRGFRWKTYVVFALAPLAAQGLLFLQNVWYLGLNDSIRDFWFTFSSKSEMSKGYNRYCLFWNALIKLFSNLYKPSFLILLFFIFYSINVKFFKKEGIKELPSLRLVFILFLCGLIFLFVFPRSGEALYQTRQLIPSVALLVSATTWSFLKVVKQSFCRRGYFIGIIKNCNIRKKIILLYMLICLATLAFFWQRLMFNKWEPYFIPPYHPDILLDKQIKSTQTKYDPVIFEMGSFLVYHDLNYVPGFHQIDPVNEYF